jgi:hypothetical protein
MDAARQGYVTMLHRISSCRFQAERQSPDAALNAIPMRMQTSLAGKYEPKKSKEGASPHPHIHTDGVSQAKLIRMVGVDVRECCLFPVIAGLLMGLSGAAAPE